MQLVFFDLETSGFAGDEDVLQIAARYPNCTSDFNAYMLPTKPIPPDATAVNGLTLRSGRLHYKGSPVSTETQRDALLRLYDFLKQIGDKCIMIAHNCTFDSYYLLRIIKEEGLVDDFARVIDSFTDTLEMLRNRFPDRRYQKGRLTLKTLADELSLSTESVHDAGHDAWLLEKIALHHFPKVELIANKMPFGQALKIRR